MNLVVTLNVFYGLLLVPHAFSLCLQARGGGIQSLYTLTFLNVHMNSARPHSVYIERVSVCWKLASDSPFWPQRDLFLI